MNILRYILPPANWRRPVVILMGVLTGIALYAFVQSNALSYLSDDSETCINCHIMKPQYATWNHSTHRRYTNCNDCHVPHDNVANKYFFKAKDGLRHATIFTLRGEPQVIQIKEEGKAVVQENCKRCHERTNQNVSAGTVSLQSAEHGNGKICWQCHREVPHGTVNSISSVRNVIDNRTTGTVPDWLQKTLDQQKKE